MGQESGREARVLEEEIVTARRRQEALTEIPLAITALNEDFLHEQNVTELRDLGVKSSSLRFSVGRSSLNL